MKRSTMRQIDGFAMVLGAMLTPVGAWAKAGATTDFGSIVATAVLSIIAGCAAIRLWIAPHPRTPEPGKLEGP